MLYQFVSFAVLVIALVLVFTQSVLALTALLAAVVVAWVLKTAAVFSWNREEMELFIQRKISLLK